MSEILNIEYYTNDRGEVIDRCFIYENETYNSYYTPDILKLRNKITIEKINAKLKIIDTSKYKETSGSCDFLISHEDFRSITEPGMPGDFDLNNYICDNKLKEKIKNWTTIKI